MKTQHALIVGAVAIGCLVALRCAGPNFARPDFEADCKLEVACRPEAVGSCVERARARFDEQVEKGCREEGVEIGRVYALRRDGQWRMSPQFFGTASHARSPSGARA
jgi:hypothetical protein